MKDFSDQGISELTLAAQLVADKLCLGSMSLQRLHLSLHRLSHRTDEKNRTLQLPLGSAMSSQLSLNICSVACDKQKLTVVSDLCNPAEVQCLI